MTSPSFELQDAVVKRLKADAPLTALIGNRVYDIVTAGAAFPHVNFGSEDVLRDDATCVTGYEINFNIDVWSEKPGYIEAKQVAYAVANALHNWDAPLPTNNLVTLQHRQTRVFRDADGLRSHGVVEFVALITD